MPLDARGLTVTTDSPDSVAAADLFSAAFLGYRTGIEAVIDAAEADPDCALLQAYAAILYLFLESPEGHRLAAPAVERARARAVTATERERLVIEAAAAWAAGDLPRAQAVHDGLAERFPTDLAMVKLGQYHRFNRGDCAGMLRLAATAEPANPEDPHLHGLLAFGYEQCHLLDLAEAAADRSLTLDDSEPWAQHALAHVWLTQGRIADGAAAMRRFSDGWAGLNSFMRTHNWWHAALFEIDLDRPEAALALYDREIWGVWKDYSQDQVNAASLLARLELRGVDVGDRWRDLADHCAARAGDHEQPFLDLHYLYALARAGGERGPAMLADLERFAWHDAPAWSADAWRVVAVPAAQGLVAHARGDVGTAADRLGVALPRLREIGGSHAQRDLFHLIHLDALVRGGRLVEAQQLLEPMRQSRPAVPWTHRTLAGLYDRLGLAAQATAADAAARLAADAAAQAAPHAD
jgi:hypothetical protein